MGSASKVLKAAAPIGLSLAFPGLGTGIGTALGATGAGAGALGSGLLGAGGGLLSGGGLKGALLGGAGGALGGYAGAGGFDGTGLGDLIGNAAGSPLSGAQGPTMGSGLLGGAAKAGSGLGDLLGGGGGSSSYALPALGAANSLYTNYEAQKKLKGATNEANSYLSPYANTGAGATGKLSDFLGLGGSGASSEDILAASPGYKFALDQGNQALDRQQSARGNFYSGRAIKEGQDYASGLANQTANDYYSKLAQTSGQGLSAAGMQGNNTTALGSAGAASQIASGNMLSQLLSGMGRRVIGYSNGQPIYG